MVKAIVGANWGDEGKGKIIDILASRAEVVVRSQGGNNAGHTVESNGQVYKLQLIPSGILYPNTLCLLGSGVVINPEGILGEIDGLESRGISCDMLRIDPRAHVIMPWHLVLDGLSEKMRGKSEIGTTKKGIGPCYMDKAERSGLRMYDLVHPELFREKVLTYGTIKNRLLTDFYHEPALDLEEIIERYTACGKRLERYLADVSVLAYDALKAGKEVLFEGAQGTLLDIDHGTYPFVTSSSCCAGGAATGTGVGPAAIDRVLGIQKAYVTRVGEGPFPTELKFPENGGVGQDAEDGELLCAAGHEFGVTTGRKRRCGWFDAVIGRYAAEVNGLTDVALTKLDVLSAFDTIKVCVAYECGGERYDYFPMQQSVLHHAKPIYVELPGWKDIDITGCKTYEELPENTRKYIEYLEEVTGVPMSIISVGPDRDQTIMRNW